MKDRKIHFPKWVLHFHSQSVPFVTRGCASATSHEKTNLRILKQAKSVVHLINMVHHTPFNID